MSKIRHALVCCFASIPERRVRYDACAAPVGKAVGLEQWRGVVAGDRRPERLPRLADTTRRAEWRSVACGRLEAAPVRAESLDAVLVDAPCTATGTMRRHPDARWRLHPEIFARAAARQARLLAAAARLVRSGGLLIYATCSLEPEENAAVVEDFLSQHPAFMRQPPSKGEADAGRAADRGGLTSVAPHGMGSTAPMRPGCGRS